ncbi:Uu.00g091730.m01.CDS01 [Anthostomella pinea]|uniref:Uu.00g091730.m01.CDS01 n=1 Tax=Anthostomella pinea TaxID=933095 RepID=A0AAI8VNS4_9PEZI|nr:Uu.00g091730.m01.CDS01 [Anthostomella pinea]
MDSMDLDLEMDVDVDVDLVADEPIVAEPDFQYTSGNRSRSPGEVDEDPEALAPTKVHIRGLDILKPDDIKAYVAECCPESPLERIEWIDDSSANLLFASEPEASQALIALAAEAIYDVSQLSARSLLAAKAYSNKPEIALQVRRALASDRKEVGAASRSRFYLLNPEYDHEERRRRNEGRRYRDRDGDDYSRRRARHMRGEEGNDDFDVSLYDDDQGSKASQAPRSQARRRRSYTPDSERDEQRRRSYHNENRGKELFPGDAGGNGGFSRDRSASPARARYGDGDITEGLSREGSAARDRNRDKARAIKSHMSRRTRTRELFPDEAGSGSGRLGDSVEDAATLLAKGIMLPLMDGSSDTPPTQGRKLQHRITAPGQGRLADRISSPGRKADKTFSIRGAASQRRPDQGFAIKGVAGKSVKELFPDKFGSSSGKEHFAEGLEGRSRRRQRAGDLFD